MVSFFQFSAAKANSPLLAFLLLAVPFSASLCAETAAPEEANTAVQGMVAGDSAPVPQQTVSSQLTAQDETAQTAPSAASVEAQAWLTKLADAVANREYRGLVTFEHVGAMETLEVVHGIRNGEQVERVRYLTGAPRELVSRGLDAQCRREGSPLSRAGLWSATGLQNVQENYHFLLRGEERVADRDAVVVDVRPRDQHRFGLVISIDKETGLPLKSVLITPHGRALERFQFVELDLSPVKDEDLQPQSADAREAEGAGHCGSLVSRWRLGWVPNGFKAVATRELADGEMLVYSDGLNAFTVFVQSLGPNMSYRGRAVRGATVAYMDHIQVNDTRYTVTVVGEIPDGTAELVAKSVQTGH
ncbi:MucB/RseB C-terminal domain-containing protein [Microbulbifer bruguierae]|uniref:MucB/RseB C-terminal domain-containing protein n=1 Tax=Microbulbifer bruguierae TaxID=3029061 RepID=A0ABY8ND36_9GAMM|nr:MucB/RseB C-terminal domain-containing protein [Microbulbifer bruguierae]WGL16708.1 MucB/RseB C-terminal domain-containing protein [Microbulbifer bruguierae]